MLPPGCMDTWTLSPAHWHQGSALNSIFFPTWLLPPHQAGVLLGERVMAPLCIPRASGGSLAFGAPLPLPPAQHTGSERLFTVRPWPQQHLAHLQKRLKRGTAARCCRDGGARQKHAVPGAAGLAGLDWGGSQSRGAPQSSLTPILPAWPWRSPGSLRNKLIQITAREIHTRREPLPAAVLWPGAPTLPCPDQRLSPTPGPPNHYKIQSPAKQRWPLMLQGSHIPEAAQPLPEGWIQHPVSHQNISRGGCTRCTPPAQLLLVRHQFPALPWDAASAPGPPRSGLGKGG